MSNAQWGVLIMAGVILVIWAIGRGTSVGAGSKILTFLQASLAIPGTWFQSKSGGSSGQLTPPIGTNPSNGGGIITV